MGKKQQLYAQSPSGGFTPGEIRSLGMNSLNFTVSLSPAVRQLLHIHYLYFGRQWVSYCNPAKLTTRIKSESRKRGNLGVTKTSAPKLTPPVPFDVERYSLASHPCPFKPQSCPAHWGIRRKQQSTELSREPCHLAASSRWDRAGVWMKLGKTAYAIPSLVSVKRAGNFGSEGNYVLPSLLFMVCFCHLVVRRQQGKISAAEGSA